MLVPNISPVNEQIKYAQTEILYSKIFDFHDYCTF